MCIGHYSPKINQEQVGRLYHIAKQRQITMTKLVNEIIGKWLKEWDETIEQILKICELNAISER